MERRLSLTTQPTTETRAKKLSLETRAKMSEAKKGEKHPH